MTPKIIVRIEEDEKEFPITVDIADPFVYHFAFTLEEAEALSNQLLSVCQDYRNERAIRNANR